MKYEDIQDEADAYDVIEYLRPIGAEKALVLAMLAVTYYSYHATGKDGKKAYDRVIGMAQTILNVGPPPDLPGIDHAPQTKH